MTKRENKMVEITLRFWTNDLEVIADKEAPQGKPKKVC